MVDSAFGWVSNIIQWFGQLIPRIQIINTLEGGVAFKGGKHPVAITPGLLVWWPFTTELKLYPTVRQSVDLKAQTVSTKDDRTLVAGGVLEYRVGDILTLLTSVWDADTTIKNIAAGALADILCKHSWAELQTLKGTGELGTIVKKEMRKRLHPYGVKIIRATFTDFALARVIKMIQSTSVDG